MTSLPVFTVEQIELIRRLKNSGITRQQLIHAFDSLQRLDVELGPVYSIPVNRFPIANGSCQPESDEAIITNGHSSQSTAPMDLCFRKSSTPKRSHSTAFAEESNGSTSDVNIEIVTNEELLTYLSTKPEENLVEDIREFAAKHSIRQHHIASAAGISQSYVSRFFRGDFFEMSESSRNRVYKWYLWCQKNPEAATNPYTYTMLGQAKDRCHVVPDLSTSLMDDRDRRRERFTFNSSQVAILENEFLMDNYPSTERREQLAELCNKECSSIQAGRRMCADVIANWFSNKRKEIKKLALKEGIVIETSRGRRPLLKSLSSSNSMSDQLQKGGGDKNSDKMADHPAEGVTVKTELEAVSSDYDDAQQESLAFAVEVAAVNEAIKALSGQPHDKVTANGVKAEDKEKSV